MWRFNIHPPHPHTTMQASPTHHIYAPHIIPFDDDEDDMPTTLPLAILQQSEAPSPPSMPLTIQPTRVSTTTVSTTRGRTTTPPTRSTEYHRRAYDLPSTRNLIEYLHCVAGSPTKSTFQQAVKAGNYKSFPGLSVENVARYCPENATATVLGHLTQTPKGLRSTRWATAANALLAANNSPSMLPSDVLLEALTTPTNEVTIIEVPISTLYTDDMGRFPIRAQSGNQYIMVAFHDAANVILVEPFKSKGDHHRIPAYDTLMNRLKRRGLTIDMQFMDNEVSAKFLHNISEVWKCKFQKVPPDMHRRNKAERAIRTFKAHFITILACVDQGFPRNRWDLLLPQAELTINLLRQSRLHPHISAWEQFNGPFNFDATPLGPPGCKIIGHARGSTRLSWDYRGHCGFYVGPALDHYRCHKILKTSTSAVIISDTVVFQHPTLSVPTLSTTDRIIHCLWALTIAVRADRDRTPDNCNAQLLAVESLRAIFDNHNTPTPDTTQALPPTTQIARPATLPRVNGTQPTAPRVVATLPRVAVAPPRVAAIQHPPSDTQPIAHRTRSRHTNTNSIAASAHAALRVTFSLPADHIDKSTLSRDTQYNLSPQWNTVPFQRRIESTFQPPRNRATPPTTTNRFALLADAIDDDELPTDTIIGVDNALLTMFIACPVLDHETGQLSQLCQMSACRFCCCPNSDILCRVGNMLPTCFGHVGDMTRCRVNQGVQNDTTCWLFPTCRLNVGSSVSRNSAQTYSICIVYTG